MEKDITKFLDAYYNNPNKAPFRVQIIKWYGEKYRMYIDYCDDKNFVDKNGDLKDGSEKHMHILGVDL